MSTATYEWNTHRDSPVAGDYLHQHKGQRERVETVYAIEQWEKWVGWVAMTISKNYPEVVEHVAQMRALGKHVRVVARETRVKHAVVVDDVVNAIVESSG